MTLVLDGTDAVFAHVGAALGMSPWIEITDERVASFERAASADLRYLALSLSNLFLPQIVEVRGFSSGVNLGTDRIEFGPPLERGHRVRGTAWLTAVTEVRGSLQTSMRIVVEVDGRDEPACTVDSLSRWLA